MHVYICTKIEEERRAIVEHFHCGNTLLLLMKLKKLIQS